MEEQLRFRNEEIREPGRDVSVREESEQVT